MVNDLMLSFQFLSVGIVAQTDLYRYAGMFLPVPFFFAEKSEALVVISVRCEPDNGVNRAGRRGRRRDRKFVNGLGIGQQLHRLPGKSLCPGATAQEDTTC